MTFAILRCQKIKSVAQARAAYAHNFRERQVANASSDPLPKLISGTGNVQDLLDKLPEQRRKDATLAGELLLTASPEFWVGKTELQMEAWIGLNLKWLNKEFPGRVLSVALHTDETSPHLHVILDVFDQKTQKLNGAKVLGGPAHWAKRQSEYAKEMSVFGLARGIKGSKTKHKRPRTLEADKMVEAHEYHSMKKRYDALQSNIGLYEKWLSIALRDHIGIATEKEQSHLDHIAKRIIPEEYAAFQKSKGGQGGAQQPPSASVSQPDTPPPVFYPTEGQSIPRLRTRP